MFEAGEAQSSIKTGTLSRLSQEIMLARGILRPDEIVEVDMIDMHLLTQVHDKSYIQRVEMGALSYKEKVQLGMPDVAYLYEKCATEAEATRLTCRAALEEGISVCIGGGRQHAFANRGEISSVFNDIAIAVRDLQHARPGLRIMVVDTDALSGSGMNALLVNDPHVFIYTIHSGLGQRNEVQGNMDVKVPRFLEGDLYLKMLFCSLATALERFVPDLIIWVSGADQLRGDKLGGMWLDQKDLSVRDEVLLGALLGNRIPLAILYGGAYNQDQLKVAEAYCNMVASAKRIAAKAGLRI